MGTEREKFLIKNSLISLLKGVEGHETTVELRNENYVTGKIEYVDAFMNIQMKNVEFTSFRGGSQQFCSFFVQGANIRYVHIPDEINMIKTIDHQVNKDRRMREKIAHDVKDAAWKKITKRQQEYDKAEKLKERQRQFEEKKVSKNTKN